ncbi:ferredoxin reductase [Terrabacter sp. NPDC080008]|uniref:ferredoxin reductase n=1 Tax=Terrabacter sp. NPDC080008 TaxID=3155176 RepID=UPI0034508768
MTLVLGVDGWPGHLPGQHVDVRLTAADGYTATRSYSLAAPQDGDRIELTVQRVPDGEVSPFLADGLAVGDTVRLRGPVGGWFVWRPAQPEPVLLVAGGSGVVPLMAMLRARAAVGGPPFRLVYSVRSAEDVLYRERLTALAAVPGIDVRLVHTRKAPEGEDRPAGRLGAEDLGAPSGEGADRSPVPLVEEPTCYVCGPTGFVEAAANLLVDLGHAPDRIRTERFGPSGP